MGDFMENTQIQRNLQMNIEGIKQLSIMYNNLGTLDYENKNYKKALSNFEEALKYYDILYRSIDKTVSINADFINILQQQIFDTKIYIMTVSEKLGDEKYNDCDYSGALEYYKNIISCNLDEQLCLKVSRCLEEIGAYISAISFLNVVAGLNSQNSEIYLRIANIFNNKLKDYNNALMHYEKYIQVEKNDKSNLAEAYLQISSMYELLDNSKNTDKKISYLLKAIELDPTEVTSWRNLSKIYIRKEKYDEALDCYKKIFDLGATMDDFFSYACLNIKLRNFKEGWKYYEYRFSKENNPTIYPKMPKPKWKGEDISDKTILVHYEQDFGDTIQFLRYIDLLKPLTKKIILKVQDELTDITKLNLKDIDVYKASLPIDSLTFDYHIPLMSLPRRLEDSVEDIPNPEKYIVADSKKTDEYRKNYFNNDNIKIGICWHGKKDGVIDRDIPFETFFELAKLKNVRLYSFQKNITVEELDKLPMGIDIVKLGKTFKDLSDTAAAMANLDYFITSDDGVFNLAGAMGIRTYLLLNKASDWKCFTDEKTTPWYSSITVHKKENESETWDSFMKKIITDISSKK